MTEELIDIVDEDNKELRITETKNEAHAKGLWHRASHVWILNSKGEVLLQKRSLQKDSDPGLWDISAAGHLSAGETPEEAALRELQEEIGITVHSKKLKQIMIAKKSAVPKKGYYNNEFDYVYVLRLDQLPSKLQREEVAEVKFMRLDSFAEELENQITVKRYVPHAYYRKLIIALKKELTKTP